MTIAVVAALQHDPGKVDTGFPIGIMLANIHDPGKVETGFPIGIMLANILDPGKVETGFAARIMCAPITGKMPGLRKRRHDANCSSVVMSARRGLCFES